MSVRLFVLNAYGKYLDDSRPYPILQRMLNSPNLSRAAVLHFLALHDSTNVQPVLAAETVCRLGHPLLLFAIHRSERCPERKAARWTAFVRMVPTVSLVVGLGMDDVVWTMRCSRRTATVCSRAPLACFPVPPRDIGVRHIRLS